MKKILWGFALLLLFGSGVVILVRKGADGTTPNVVPSDANARPSAIRDASSTVAQVKRIRIAESQPNARTSPEKAVVDGFFAVTNEMAQSDEKIMSEVMNDLLVFLADAVKARDIKRIGELLSKLKALNYGRMAGRSSGSKASTSIKRWLIQELAAMAPYDAAQLVGQVADLMGDSDLAVSLQAKELVFNTLKEPTLSDRVRAEIVTEAMTDLEDAESIARLYQEFIRMRHSVGVAAFTEIDASGSAAAKAQLARAMGGFTSDAGITTISQLNDWFAENGDNEIDDVFFGNEDVADENAKTK